MFILMIAPGHDAFDRRVLRTVEVLRNLGHKVSLFLENHRLGKKPHPIEVFGYDAVSISSLVLRKTSAFDPALLDQVMLADVIYVHDSGIYGQRLLKVLAGLNQNAKFVFDYHDWCSWEMVHHGKKITKRQLPLSCFLALGRFISRHTSFLRAPIGALVGITDSQVQHYEKDLGYPEELLKCSIPNTRIRIAEAPTSNKATVGPDLSLLWVGNIGNGRGFEDILALRAAVQHSGELDLQQIGLTVFGKFWGGYSSALLSGIDFRGAFASDQEIADNLPEHRVIGVFQGWQDSFSTGINQIASPNKVYTYLNLGIPFLVWHELEDFIKAVEVPDAFIYSGESDFVEKVKYIYENYDAMQNRTLCMKEAVIWDEEASRKLRQFFLRFLGPAN